MSQARQNHGKHHRPPARNEPPEGFLSPPVRLDPSLYNREATIRHCREAERERVGEKHYAYLKALRKRLWLKKQHEAYKAKTRFTS